MDFDWQSLLNNSSVQGIINGAVNSVLPQKTVKAAPVQVLAPTPAPSVGSSMDMKTIALWGGVAMAVVLGLALILKGK